MYNIYVHAKSNMDSCVCYSELTHTIKLKQLKNAIKTFKNCSKDKYNIPMPILEDQVIELELTIINLDKDKDICLAYKQVK